MQDYINRTIAAYDASPEKFEERTKDIPPSDELKWLMEDLPTGAKVLDAGCAYGRDSYTLQHTGYKPTGIDLSKALLARARELHPDIPFQEANVCQLPFEDAAFDGIWANAVLLHLNDEDVRLALNEFHRVLVPGGRLFVSFKKGSGMTNHLDSFTSNDERFYNYKQIEALRPMLESAGFKISKWRYFNEKELSVTARDLEWLNVHALRETL